MAAKSTPAVETMDDLLDRLGGVSPSRVRMTPPPGQATVRDVIHIRDKERRLFELVDGTLVEKVMGTKESSVAMWIGHLLLTHSELHGGLGMVLGEAGTLKLLKKLVRIPDVSFTSWDQLPTRQVPREPVPELAPDLVVEVLSRKNTRREMERKLKEYFLSGVRLAWLVDPATRRVRVFESPDDVVELGPDDVLDGGEVLPGLRIPVSKLFAELGDTHTKKPKKKRK